MTRLRSLTARQEGAVAVLVAVVLPLLLAMGAFASGSLVIAGAERELHRAAGAAALAAASQMVVVDPTVTVTAPTLPELDLLPDDTGVGAEALTMRAAGAATLPLRGSAGRPQLLPPLDPITDPLDPILDPLDPVLDPIEEALTEALAELPLIPEAISLPTTPAAAAACAVGAANLDRAPMIAAFGAHPAAADACGPYGPASSAVLSVGTEVDVFAHTLAELAALTAQVPELASQINVPSLLPTLVAPRVRVRATSQVRPPFGLLVDADPEGTRLAGEAVARRWFKNAIVIPSTAVRCRIPLGGVLGNWVGRLPDLPVPVPNPVVLLQEQLCHVDLNQGLDEIGDQVFTELEAFAAQVDAAFAEHGVPSPITGTCLMGALTYELRSIYDPPGQGREARETARAILAEARQSGGEVQVFVVGTAGALGTPILDAIPVAVSHLEGEEPWRAATGAGVFRASLMEESPLPASGAHPGCSS